MANAGLTRHAPLYTSHLQSGWSDMTQAAPPTRRALIRAMSLFKARRWWSAAAGSDEFHDLGSLCVANIDNSAEGYDKIIVGSFQGVVRIYQPRPSEFSPDHVMLEKQLAPVLQLAVGRFIQGSSDVHLASLHPRELCVHTLTSSQTDDGLVYALSLAYKHPLARTACNMACGGFGGAKEVELICVQSMDGLLQFFQGDSVGFTAVLPEFLLPGPLAYCSRTDSIITASSSHVLSAFRYQSLVVGSSDGQQASKSPTAEWSACLGEGAVDVKVVGARPALLLVLGERSVFCFNDSGVLRFMKKLDFSPSCCHAYGLLPNDSVQYLVASHSGPVLVFRDWQLVWTASLEHPPADIATARFQELEGVLVSVDELGHVTCSYLGTDPTLFTAPSQRSLRQLDYTELDSEMALLQQSIKEAQRDGGPALPSQSSLLVQAAAVGSARLVQLGAGLGEEPGAPCKSVEVKVQLTTSAGGEVKDVTVSVSAPPPLTTHPSHFHIERVSEQPSDHVITVVCSPSTLPTLTALEVSATYTSANGVPHVLSTSVELPLALFCEPAPPSKAASFKITIDTNQPCQSLRLLFADCLASAEGPDNAVGFALLTGAEVTLVSSRSSSRYRLQSESFPAMALFLWQLLDRLSKRLASHTPPFQANYSSSLPLNEYFDVLEKHFALRLDLRQCGQLLSRHSQQFRAVQKRLLTRFKDKTPVGLAHLDTLLDGTYMQLMALGDRQEELQAALAASSSELSCATSLLCCLLRLAVGMSDSEFALLQSVLSPCSVSPAGSPADQGWEEQTDVAITHLLRTSLAKSARDSAAGGGAMELQEDCSKLKRHIALLCDRISKGGTLGTPNEATRSLSEGTVGGRETVTPRLPVALHFKHKPSLPSLPEHAD